MPASGNLLAALNANVGGTVAIQVTGALRTIGTQKTWYFTNAPSLTDGTNTYMCRILSPVTYVESIGLTTDLGADSEPNKLEITLDNHDGVLDEMMDYEFAEGAAKAYHGALTTASGSAFSWSDYELFLDGVIDGTSSLRFKYSMVPSNSRRPSFRMPTGSGSGEVGALGVGLDTISMTLLSCKAEGYERYIVKDVYTGDGYAIDHNNSATGYARMVYSDVSFDVGVSGVYTGRITGKLHTAVGSERVVFGLSDNTFKLALTTSNTLKLYHAGATRGTTTWAWPLGVRVDIGFTYDGSDFTLYVDGVEEETISTAVAPTSPAAGYFYVGYYADIEISEAAFADDIAVDLIGSMAAGPIPPLTGGWGALWKFETGTGSTAYDASGYGNDLTIGGGSSWIVTDGGDDPTYGSSGGVRGDSKLLYMGGYRTQLWWNRTVAVKRIPAVLLSEVEQVYSAGYRMSSGDGPLNSQITQVYAGEEPLQLEWSVTGSNISIAALPIGGVGGPVGATHIISLAGDLSSGPLVQTEDIERLVPTKPGWRTGSRIKFSSGSNQFELEVVGINNDSSVGSLGPEAIYVKLPDGSTDTITPETIASTLSTVYDTVTTSDDTNPRTFTLSENPGNSPVTFDGRQVLNTALVPQITQLLGRVNALARRTPDQDPDDVDGSDQFTGNTENGLSNTEGPAIGLVIASGEDRTLRDVVRQLLNSDFAYLRDDAGTSYAGYIKPAAGSPTWSLEDTGDRTVVSNLARRKLLPPIWQLMVLYDQMNASQPQVAVTVTELAGEAQEAKSPGRYAVVQDNTTRDNHPSSKSVVWPTSLVEESSVSEVVTRLMNWFGSKRVCWEIEADIVGRFKSPGTEMTLTFPRLGFDSGKDLRVFAIAYSDLTAAGSRGATITAWE